jgi:hypothetical protein
VVGVDNLVRSVLLREVGNLGKKSSTLLDVDVVDTTARADDSLLDHVTLLFSWFLPVLDGSNWSWFRSNVNWLSNNVNVLFLDVVVVVMVMVNWLSNNVNVLFLDVVVVVVVVVVIMVNLVGNNMDVLLLSNNNDGSNVNVLLLNNNWVTNLDLSILDNMDLDDRTSLLGDNDVGLDDSLVNNDVALLLLSNNVDLVDNNLVASMVLDDDWFNVDNDLVLDLLGDNNLDNWLDNNVYLGAGLLVDDWLNNDDFVLLWWSNNNNDDLWFLDDDFLLHDNDVLLGDDDWSSDDSDDLLGNDWSRDNSDDLLGDDWSRDGGGDLDDLSSLGTDELTISRECLEVLANSLVVDNSVVVTEELWLGYHLDVARSIVAS